jgi:hypothetical protein
MRRKLLRILLGMVAVQVTAWVVGLLISKRMTSGDEQSDEFQVAAVFGGKKFQSRATGLRSGTAVASMGGVDLDLRDATLDPAGAELELKATMGGVQVTVPEDWAVEVDTETRAGGFDVDVTPLEDLPDDAPRLHIHALTRMGGGVVTTKAA